MPFVVVLNDRIRRGFLLGENCPSEIILCDCSVEVGRLLRRRSSSFKQFTLVFRRKLVGVFGADLDYSFSYISASL